MTKVIGIFAHKNWAHFYFKEVAMLLKTKQPGQWKIDQRHMVLTGIDVELSFASNAEYESGKNKDAVPVYFDKDHYDAIRVYAKMISAARDAQFTKEKFSAIAEGIKKASSASSDT